MILAEFIRNGCGKNVSCVIYKFTKKAGYIWMYYSDYINKLKIKSK